MTPQNEPQEVNMINQQAFENWAMDQGDSPHRLLVGRAWARAWHAACAYKALTPSPETELRAEVERDVENAYPILSRRNLALRANLEAAELDLRATKARAEAAEARVKELESDRDSETRWAQDYFEKWEAVLKQLTAETKKREAILKLFSQIADKAYCDALDLHKRTECLGADAKMKDGSFGRRELDELLRAERLLGKHYGIYEALKSIPSTNSPITGSKLVVPPDVATVAKSATVPPEVVEKVVEALKNLHEAYARKTGSYIYTELWVKSVEALALVEKVRSSSKPSSVVMEKGQS